MKVRSGDTTLDRLFWALDGLHNMAGMKEDEKQAGLRFLAREGRRVALERVLEREDLENMTPLVWLAEWCGLVESVEALEAP